MERRLEARRLWIGWALTPHGQVVIDDGAAAALRDSGRSLLGVGVVAATGDFNPGDPVEIVTQAGTLVARGLVNYSTGDVQRMAGLSTAAAGEQLGSAFSREVVHRDDLVVLASTS